MAHWASVHSSVLVGCVLLAGAMSVSAQAPPLERMDLVMRSVPDGPIAHINGASIPRAEFMRVYRMEVLRAAAARGSAEAVDDRLRIGLGLRVLSNLVNQELLYQEAKKKNLTIPGVESLEGKASFNFVEAPLHFVVAVLAREAKMNFIVGPDVNGTVTVATHEPAPIKQLLTL